MGLAKISTLDPVHNVLIQITTLQQSDGTPVDPVAENLPVTVAFPVVGAFPDGTTAWRAASWVTVTSGGYRVRCQVGSGATGALPPARYQPYVKIEMGGETITVPAADVLESY